MTAYVDDAAIMFRSKLRYHLIADSVEELHAFCRKVGINRCWFHNSPKHPHYDITGPQRDDAIAAGAIAVTSEELLLRTDGGQRTLKRLLEERKDDPEEVARLTRFLKTEIAGVTGQLF